MRWFWEQLSLCLSTFGFSRRDFGLAPRAGSFVKEFWKERKEEMALELDSEESDRVTL